MKQICDALGQKNFLVLALMGETIHLGPGLVNLPIVEEMRADSLSIVVIGAGWGASDPHSILVSGLPDR